MAKKCWINRLEKRIKLVEKFAAKVATLKKLVSNKTLSPDERFQAQLKLNKVPLNAHKIRKRNRCLQCARPRGVYRKFGLCRLCLRKAMVRGEVPGLVKSSW